MNTLTHNRGSLEARIEELVQVLEEFDGLSVHQYSGTQKAMSDLTYAMQRGARELERARGIGVKL